MFSFEPIWWQSGWWTHWYRTCITPNRSTVYEDACLLSDWACSVASIFAEISAIWAPSDFIQWSINDNNFCSTDSSSCIVHRSLRVLPDLNVWSQLRWPMLNNVLQAAPMREKPSPDAARQGPYETRAREFQYTSQYTYILIGIWLSIAVKLRIYLGELLIIHSLQELYGLVRYFRKYQRFTVDVYLACGQAMAGNLTQSTFLNKIANCGAKSQWTVTKLRN